MVYIVVTISVWVNKCTNKWTNIADRWLENITHLPKLSGCKGIRTASSVFNQIN